MRPTTAILGLVILPLALGGCAAGVPVAMLAGDVAGKVVNHRDIDTPPRPVEDLFPEAGFVTDAGTPERTGRHQATDGLACAEKRLDALSRSGAAEAFPSSFQLARTQTMFLERKVTARRAMPRTDDFSFLESLLVKMEGMLAARDARFIASICPIEPETAVS